MHKSLFARLLAILAVTAVLLLGFSPTANAAVDASVETTGGVSAVIPVDDASSPSSACGSSAGSPGAAKTALLPVVRWADATADMHSRLDNSWMGETANLIQRHQLIGNGMAAGNFMWSLGTGLSSFAINFCLLDSAGGAADEIGATIGKILLDSPLMAFLIVFVVGALLWQGHRRGSMPWKTLAVKAVIVGLFAAMVAGSVASTGGGKNGDMGKYVPGVMSPGWIVTSMNNTVSSLASAPAAALAGNKSTQLKTGDGKTAVEAANVLSCENYMASLGKGYQDTYGTGAAALASGVPLIMSSLWEKTGLQTWRTAQFGPSGLDENTWCRLLEFNSSSRTIGQTMDGDRLAGASTVRGIMFRVMGEFGLQTVYETSAFRKMDNATVDKSLMAWSACRLAAGADPKDPGSWSITSEFSEGDKEAKATPEDCHQWFTKTDDRAGAFDWPQHAEDVQNRTDNMDLRDYVQTIHGNTNSYGLTSVFAYVLSALCMLGVFGLVSLAIIIAKIALVVMIITAFFMMIVVLMPSAGLEKLGGFLKTLLGMNMFIFGVQLLFALISILTQMLQTAGSSFLGGPGSLVAILWSGLSPVIAVGLLHMMFTKIMKVPSPFKLSAGLAWGGAAGGAAGAAFAGVSNMLDRKQGGMKGAASRAGTRGVRAVGAGTKAGLGKAKGVLRRGAASPAEAVAAAGKANGAKASGTKAQNASAPDSAAKADGVSPKEATAAAAGKTGDFGAALSTTSVPNSALAVGKMSRAERSAVKEAQSAELKAAKAHHASESSDGGRARPAPTARIASAALDSIANAGHAFKTQPFKATKKASKVVLGGALLAAAVPALPAAALAGGALAAAHGVKKLANKRAMNDELVENYRASARNDAAARKKAAEAKESKVTGSKKGSDDDKAAPKVTQGRRAATGAPATMSLPAIPQYKPSTPPPPPATAAVLVGAANGSKQ